MHPELVALGQHLACHHLGHLGLAIGLVLLVVGSEGRLF
jgi:hypothetical protein